MAKLKNDKYERFAQEYQLDSNKTQAAIRAGYSKNGADSKGGQLYGIIRIRERIDELRAETAERCKITIDEIVTELGEQFRVDPNEVFEDNGNLKPFNEMTDRARRSIKSIQKKTFTSAAGTSEDIKAEMYDKHGAAEKLLKHLGGYERDNKQKEKIIVTNQDRDDRIEELLAKAKKDG